MTRMKTAAKTGRGARVAAIKPGSAASEAGLEGGDIVLGINGSPIADIIDYRFLETDTHLELEVMKKDGELWVIDIDKDYDEDIGIEFESVTFDGIKTCRNRCIFCFIDQLPGGLRESLYVKDDDYRLSFLYGNFITLTNMAHADLERIARMKLSPLYISVHATLPEIRARLLGNRNAGRVMDQIGWLAGSGIEMHIQVVLCPGLNDGRVLDTTISDLAGFWPRVKSIGVVPVGLTRYRDGLHPLRPVTKLEAQAVVDQIEGWAAEFRRRVGYSFCFAADEFYLMAGREGPDASAYEDFPQLENGIGLIRLFRDELDKLRGLQAPTRARGGRGQGRISRSISVVTGILAQDIIKEAASFVEESLPGLSLRVYPVRNRFFGDTISVAGLVTGRDVIETLSAQGAPTTGGIAIPSVMLKAGENVFLDGMSTGDIEAALHGPVHVIEPTPGALFKLACEIMGERVSDARSGRPELDPATAGHGERRVKIGGEYAGCSDSGKTQCGEIYAIQ